MTKQAFKVFVEGSYQLDSPKVLKDLRTQYPICFYKAGMRKDVAGLYILSSLEKDISYIHNYKTNDKEIWRTEELPLDTYESMKDNRQYKISVKLLKGIEIFIRPATLEPREISLFSSLVDDKPFSTATEYGRIAYQIFDKLNNKIDLKLGDKLILDFIKMALKGSYSFPVELWEGTITAQDIEPILYAGLGVNDDLLQKKSEHSE